MIRRSWCGTEGFSFPDPLFGAAVFEGYQIKKGMEEYPSCYKILINGKKRTNKEDSHQV